MTGEPAVDPGRIRALLEMTGDDPAFVDELAEAYLEDAPAQLALARLAIDAGSAIDLVRPAHTLKSNSANVGALPLSELCRELEGRARAGQIDDAGSRLDAIESELDRVVGELGRLRAARWQPLAESR